MAKNFIALEETSQAIKTTVEDIQTDVGDGAGTDLVTRVANLEAKIDALASGGGGGKTYKLLPSTSACVYYDETSRNVTSGGTVVATITPKYSGFLAIACYYQTGHNTAYSGKITVNDTVVASSAAGPTAFTTDQFLIFQVDAGTAYTIKAINSDSTSKYYGTIKDFGIYGELVENNKIFNEA